MMEPWNSLLTWMQSHPVIYWISVAFLIVLAWNFLKAFLRVMFILFVVTFSLLGWMKIYALSTDQPPAQQGVVHGN